MRWLTTWLTRLRLRRKVDWRDCAWSPQKAAERRMVEHWTRMYVDTLKIQTESESRRLIAEYSSKLGLADAIRLANRARYDQIRAEYEKIYALLSGAKK